MDDAVAYVEGSSSSQHSAVQICKHLPSNYHRHSEQYVSSRLRAQTVEDRGDLGSLGRGFREPGSSPSSLAHRYAEDFVRASTNIEAQVYAPVQKPVVVVVRGGCDSEGGSPGGSVVKGGRPTRLRFF